MTITLFVEGPGINSFLAAALGSELPRDLHAPHRTPLPAASPAAPRQCLRGAGSLPAALPVHVRRPPRSHRAAGTGPLDFLTPSSLPSWVGLWAGREGRGFRLPASGRAVSGARESEPRGPCSGSLGPALGRGSVQVQEEPRALQAEGRHSRATVRISEVYSGTRDDKQRWSSQTSG